MKHIEAMTCATLALLMGVGCGAGDPGQPLESGELVEPEPAANIEASAGSAGADTETTSGPADVAAGAELARVEFTDGNVVRFEELNGGVLVSEVSSELNQPHLALTEGLTALDAFRALAPESAVPAALMRVHERMYSAGEALSVEQDLNASAAPLPAGEELPSDLDLEHNGEFQQSLPAANFLATMCDFPTGSGSYKHANRTAAHTDISMDVHSAYFAVGSDRGTITAQPCAGKNAPGAFDGQCGSTISLPAGFQDHGFYDAGPDNICTTKAGVTICVPNQKRFELRYGKISTSVNFHECAQITH